MPQLDKFTYFTQFFWSCLFFFTFYIPMCNDGDGILGISRILKLRNQLLSHRGNNIRSNDPNRLEDILRKGFSTGVSYMYFSLFEVSQWCNGVDLLGKRRKITWISCFGEISGKVLIVLFLTYLYHSLIKKRLVAEPFLISFAASSAGLALQTDGVTTFSLTPPRRSPPLRSL